MKLNMVMCLLLVAVVVFANGDAFGQFAWTKDSRNPIFSGGGTGAWDNDVGTPLVIFNSDSARYEMWYTGSLPSGGIGFAISNDGIAWTRSANPVLSRSAGTWDSYFLGAPCVIRENGQYRMWYTGAAASSPIGVGVTRIGYATSPDGRNWTKYAGNPVLTAGASAWEAGAVAICSIVKSAAGYVMFYTGSSTAYHALIGRATSVDGITWQRDSLHNPVLEKGGTGAWDGQIYLPSVLDLGGKYYLWYTAETVPGDGVSRIGLATSNDSGKTWVKYAQNPVLTMGPSGSWDVDWVELGSVLRVGNTFHMWYDGGAPPAYQSKVGHATSVLVGVAEEGRGLPEQFILSQNYPNPFNPSTVIRYGLPHKSQVSLMVYNTLGQLVSQLVSDEQEAGYHEVKFDGLNLTSGVYFYRLHAGDFVATKKLIVLR
jgi:predicted GH43/DUF377 family glycosyl hydrolase